jgi:hypothetical protein
VGFLSLPDKWRDEDDEPRVSGLYPPLTYGQAVEKHQPLSDFEQGLVAGLYQHAWMKDGTYYVGTGIFTLGQAIDRAITGHRERQASR